MFRFNDMIASFIIVVRLWWNFDWSKFFLDLSSDCKFENLVVMFHSRSIHEVRDAATEREEGVATSPPDIVAFNSKKYELSFP